MPLSDQKPTLTSKQLIESARASGYFQLLGMWLEADEISGATVHLTVDKRLFHPQQIVHGGVIFTLADTSMAMTLLASLPMGSQASTIEAKINFLRPVIAGELFARAEFIHLGRSTAVLSAKVHASTHGEQKLIAQMQGTFNIKRPEQ